MFDFDYDFEDYWKSRPVLDKADGSAGHSASAEDLAREALQEGLK